MTETTLVGIFDEFCTERAIEFEKLKFKRHFFSLRHRKAMRKILYSRALPRTTKVSSSRRYIPIGKRILILVIVILAAAFMCFTAGASMGWGFNRKVYPEFTELCAASFENAPTTIERAYYLPEIPDKYDLYQKHSGLSHITTFYKNIITQRNMSFSQYVKYGYKSNLNTEHQDFEEIEINGHYALYLDFSSSKRNSGLIIWDNQDYILQLTGDFTKDELINLAKSTKFLNIGSQNSV